VINLNTLLQELPLATRFDGKDYSIQANIRWGSIA